MPAIDKLICAVRKGQHITSVRFRHRPDEMHTVVKGRNGKVALTFRVSSFKSSVILSFCLSSAMVPGVI